MPFLSILTGRGSSVIAPGATSCEVMLLFRRSGTFGSCQSIGRSQSVHRRRTMKNGGNGSAKSLLIIGTLALAAGLWSLGVDQAAAQTSDRCDSVLLTHTPSDLKARSVERLAILQLVTRDNYEQVKQHYKDAVPDYFSASFDDFNQKRLRELSSEAFDQSSDASRAVVTSSLSSGAIEAWRACMLTNGVGLTATTRNIGKKSAVLSLSWQSKENILLDDLKVVLSSGSISPADAAKLKASRQGSSGFMGEADLIVTRSQQNKAIVGVVSGKANGVLKSSSFIIPRLTALAACGSLPKETIQTRSGSMAQLAIRPSPCARTIIISATAASAPPKAPKSWLQLDVSIDKILIHSERQEIVPVKAGTVSFTLPEKALPAGGMMLVEAYHPTGSTVVRSLSLSATVSRP